MRSGLISRSRISAPVKGRSYNWRKLDYCITYDKLIKPTSDNGEEENKSSNGRKVNNLK